MSTLPDLVLSPTDEWVDPEQLTVPLAGVRRLFKARVGGESVPCVVVALENFAGCDRPVLGELLAAQSDGDVFDDGMPF